MIGIIVDLETFSTRQDAAFFAIGACDFNIEKGTYNTENFYCLVNPQSLKNAGFHFDQRTIDWWRNQSEEAKKQLILAKESKIGVIDALFLLKKYINRISQIHNTKNVYILGNGANFDIAILEYAYKKMNVPIPWNYHNVLCYRTICFLHDPNDNEKHKRFFNKQYEHHALHDAIVEARYLVEVIFAE